MLKHITGVNQRFEPQLLAAQILKKDILFGTGITVLIINPAGCGSQQDGKNQRAGQKENYKDQSGPRWHGHNRLSQNFCVTVSRLIDDR
jgi:hypothetical protein